MDKIITCPSCGTEYDITITPNCPTPKSNYLWIFDNGHGGIIDGVYQTPGKRSPVWPDGTQLFEGEFNRAIVDRLVKMCAEAGIECVNLVDTQEDVPLSERTNKANDIYKIKPAIIKDLTTYLAPKLTILYSQSIDENIYPDPLKLTKLIELYKSKDKTDPKNYRPISLLPIIAKTFDTLLNIQLMQHLIRIQTKLKHNPRSANHPQPHLHTQKQS